MDARSILVFDADDTLLATSWTYDVAVASFFEFLYTTLAGRTPSLHDVYERFFEIDAEHARTWGVKRGRVAESMVRLYLELCAYIRERYREDLYSHVDERKIRQMGDGPFHYSKHFWLPGVKEILQTLNKNSHTLCLLTSYDTNLFPERAKFLGLDKYFGGRMHCINTKKTAPDFISVSGWASPNEGKYYTIGNGESDILPAVNIAENWHAIYISYRNTSPFFKKEGKKASFDAEPIDHPRVINVRTFKEILDHV